MRQRVGTRLRDVKARCGWLAYPAAGLIHLHPDRELRRAGGQGPRKAPGPPSRAMVER